MTPHDAWEWLKAEALKDPEGPASVALIEWTRLYKANERLDRLETLMFQIANEPRIKQLLDARIRAQVMAMVTRVPGEEH